MDTPKICKDCITYPICKPYLKSLKKKLTNHNTDECYNSFAVLVFKCSAFKKHIDEIVLKG